MLKIGQSWGKIANYPPQCSTKICTPAIAVTLNTLIDFAFSPSSTFVSDLIYYLLYHLTILSSHGCYLSLAQP